MAAAETMVADVGGVAPEGSLLMDEPLLEKADESTTHAVGSGSFTNWLAENEKSAMYALARLPALHIVFWVVTLCVIGPKYFPTQTETVLSMYFGYALPRFCVILVSGSLACYWCVRRNAETATATFSDRVAPTSEMAFGVRSAPRGAVRACRLCSPLTERCVCAQDVTLIVVVCIYTEPIEKVAETLDTLASQMEVSKQMCICMATEARDQNGLRTAKELR